MDKSIGVGFADGYKKYSGVKIQEHYALVFLYKRIFELKNVLCYNHNIKFQAVGKWLF